ncbi:MAG: DoxX family membrane protein [Acidobacteriota bacterium]
MAIDRQGTGLMIIRLCLGVFFIVTAYGKLRGRWYIDSSILKGQFDLWLQNAAPGSISQAYLQRFAIPSVAVLSRLVPTAEFICGAAMLVGFRTSIFALIAFVLVLNYHIASGAIAEAGFLANRSGLPVLGSTLGLAVGGIRLRWSLRN